MVYAALIHTDLDFLQLFWYSLMFSQEPFMLSLSFMFTKAANLFEILPTIIWIETCNLKVTLF